LIENRSVCANIVKGKLSKSCFSDCPACYRALGVVFFMKYIFLSILILFSHGLLSQSHENETIDDLARVIFLQNDARRNILKSTINTFDDLVCTFWTRDCTHLVDKIDPNSFHRFDNFGYVFLPHNMVLVVRTVCRAFYSEKYNEFYCIEVYILDLGRLSTYEIKNERIVVNTGMPSTFKYERMYLKDHYLYVSYNNSEYERYRFVSKFNTFLDEVIRNW